MHNRIPFLLSVCTTLLVTTLVSCSHSVELSLTKMSELTPKGEELGFYLGRPPGQEWGRKLLVFIQGSGRFSVQERFGYGAEASLLGYDILYLEKYAYDDEKLFNATNTRQRRVDDISFVVNRVIDRIYGGKVDALAIIADSEGGSIAPEIATRLNGTTMLLILGAGGYPQSKELETLLQKELQEKRVGMMGVAGFKTVEELRKKFAEIEANPTPDSSWLGHPYRYWASYLSYDPEPYVSQLRIPTMFVMGERDESVPVESLRHLQSLLKGRDNFVFEVIPDADHGFNDSQGKNLMGKIIREKIFPWYNEVATSNQQ